MGRRLNIGRTPSPRLRGPWRHVVMIGLVVSLLPCARAEPRKAESGKPGDDKLPSSDIQQFCTNNAVAAADARIGWQTAKLSELEAQIRDKLKDLEARKAEVAEWLRKRDEAMRQASEALISIYTRMRPEAAATQLGAMDEGLAAAIVAKLPARTAGAILNEMDSGRAAKLTRRMIAPEAVSAEKKK